MPTDTLTTPTLAQGAPPAGARRVASIELGTHSAKVLVGCTRGGCRVVEAACRLVFDPRRTHEQPGQEGDARAQALAEHLTRWSGLRVASSVCCLPSALTEYESVALPDDATNPIEAAPRLLAQLGADPARVAWESWTSDVSLSAEGRTLHLVWADPHHVTRTLERLSEAGMPCERLDARPAAYTPLGADGDGVSLVVDLGHASTEMAAVAQGRLLYARRKVAIATGAMVDAVAASLGVSRTSAEAALQEWGAPLPVGGPTVAALVEEWLQSLQFELDRTSAFVRGRLTNGAPLSIVLTGGGAMMRGLAERIEERVGLPTRLPPLPRGVEWHAAEPCTPDYATALALFSWGDER